MNIKAFMCKALSKYRSLPAAAKASLWFVICSVVQKGISFFTTPIFTRIMTTEQYGQVTLYNSWINIVCIFTTLNLQYGSFNTAQIKFAADRKSYTSSIQGLVALISLLALGIIYMFGANFSSFLGLPLIILLVMIVQVYGRFTTNLWMANCRFDYRYKGMSIVVLLSCLFGQILSVVFVLLSEEKGYMRILAVALVEMMFGFGIAMYNHKQGKKFFSGKYWKYALGFNLPLIPYYLSQVVFSVSDRIMISSMVGADKAGIYGLAHTVGLLLTFVVSAIRNSYTPWFFKQMKKDDGESVKKYNMMLTLAIAGMLLAFIFVAPELLLLMGGTTYYEAVIIIPPLVAGILFEFFTDPACNTLFFFERKGSLVLATIGCAVLNIILNYFGITRVGYYATAYATLLSYILFWLFLYLCAKNICKKNSLDWTQFMSLKPQVLVGVVFLFLTAIGMMLIDLWYIRYGILLAVAITAAVNYKKIVVLVQNILAMRK